MVVLGREMVIKVMKGLYVVRFEVRDAGVVGHQEEVGPKGGVLPLSLWLMYNVGVATVGPVHKILVASL